MQEVIIGINEDDLGNLSLEILDYVDRISDIFNKIDVCMEKLPDNYQGAPCQAIIDQYNKLTPFYKVIKDNLTNYSDDLICLIKKLQEDDKYLAKLLDQYTEETKNKTKSIMN